MKTKVAPQASPARSHPRFGLVALLSAIGFGLSLYLLWGSWGSDQLPGCGPESGCGAVLHSRWASWLGVPVSVFALTTYATILGILAVWRRPLTPAMEQRVWGLLIAVAVSLLGAAVWFIGLQLFVVRAICPYCMAAHTCGLLVGGWLLSQAPFRTANRRSGSSAASAALKFVWAGVAAVVFLVAGQILHSPKTYRVQSLVAGAPTPTNRVANVQSTNGGESLVTTRSNLVIAPKRSTQTHRMMSLHGDLFQLDLDEVMMLGSPDAKCIAVHLFDYSCQHCRLLHATLLEAYQGLSNQLAVALLPMPLDAACNPFIRNPLPEHTNGCAYARTGLAVWRANPQKLKSFDTWIFAPTQAPSPEAARAEAMRLVGTNEFQAALKDPWIGQQLDFNMRLYDTNRRRLRVSRLPQLMVGTNIAWGTPRKVTDIYRLLATQFDLQFPELP